MKITLRSDGVVTLELECEADKFDETSAFIEANKLITKIECLAKYICPITKANETPRVEVKQESPKPRFEKCPDCGRNTFRTYTVKKEGANKGKVFKSCFHEDQKTGHKCGYAWYPNDWSRGGRR